MNRAVDFLRASQNSDGGWGYKPGGMSFVEPTATVITALSPDAENRAPVQRARSFLRSLQHPDGGWGIAAIDEESGWMSACAVAALGQGDADDIASAQRGVDWLLKESGIRLEDPVEIERYENVLHINARITGWAWQPGDAAWIFPTAASLLALNAMRVTDHPRVTEGIQYLLDRAIDTGGWNIGNPFMVTGNMPPTVENTVFALRALCAFHIENEATHRASEWLAQETFTPTSFEWALRALYWADTDASPSDNFSRARTALESLQQENGSWDNNPLTTGFALSALNVT